jgi:hypothetical protein
MSATSSQTSIRKAPRENITTSVAHVATLPAGFHARSKINATDFDHSERPIQKEAKVALRRI